MNKARISNLNVLQEFRSNFMDNVCVCVFLLREIYQTFCCPAPSSHLAWADDSPVTDIHV